jgi:hypothetical protein
MFWRDLGIRQVQKVHLFQKGGTKWTDGVGPALMQEL